MSGPTCATCVHWGSADEAVFDKRVDGKEIRICARAAMYWNATEWMKPEDEDDDGPVNRRLAAGYEGMTMFCQDGSDYKAVLITTSDHYCSQFRLKP